MTCFVINGTFYISRQNLVESEAFNMESAMDELDTICSNLYASQNFADAELTCDQRIKQDTGDNPSGLAKAYNNRGHAKYMQVRQ